MTLLSFMTMLRLLLEQIHEMKAFDDNCIADYVAKLTNFSSTNPKINKFKLVSTCFIILVSKSQQLVDTQHQRMLTKYT